MTGSRISTPETDMETPDFSYYSIESTPREASRPEQSFSSFVRCTQITMKWKCAMLARRTRRPMPVLQPEDLAFLLRNTDYKEEEIREWFREFIMDCPDGILTRKKVLEMLQQILPKDNGETVTNLIFAGFDKDGNGWIDFNEFIIATHCTANFSPSDKLRWVFQMYDKDQSHSIQLGEMIEVFGTLYMNEGLDKQLAVDRAVKIFSDLDIDGDGDITEEEFIKGCLKDHDLVNLLNDRSKDPPLVLVTSAESTPRNLLNTSRN